MAFVTGVRKSMEVCDGFKSVYPSTISKLNTKLDKSTWENRQSFKNGRSRADRRDFVACR